MMIIVDIQWYKESNKSKEFDEIENSDRNIIGIENQRWKPMRRRRRRIAKRK